MTPLALLFAACAPDTADPDPLPYVYEDERDDTPTLEVDAIEGAIEAFVGVALGLTALPVTDAFFAMLDAGATEACPPRFDEGDGAFFYGYCTSDAGLAFDGYSFSLAYDGYEQDGYLYDGAYVSGVFQLALDGETFDGGGDAYWLDATWLGDTDPHTYHESSVSGTFAWSGAAGGWLAEDIAPDLTLRSYWSLDYEVGMLAVGGGVRGLSGPADTVVADEVVLYPTDLATCGLEPHGTISVRGADGNWFDVLFDAPAEFDGTMPDPSLCDGCGAVWWRGVYLGEVCPDFSAWMGWEGRPW